MIASALSITDATAQDDNIFKLAFVAFISGPPAESAGKPSVQGAKTVIDALNAGGLPKPYDKVGFGGLKIQVQLTSTRLAAPPSCSLGARKLYHSTCGG